MLSDYVKGLGTRVKERKYLLSESTRPASRKSSLTGNAWIFGSGSEPLCEKRIQGLQKFERLESNGFGVSSIGDHEREES